MASLLLRNIQTLITCDEHDRILHNVDLYCEDGFIKAIGPHLPQTAHRTVDASHCWCYPGLINTHHHLYQIFSRNLPQVQGLELFDWLTACLLYTSIPCRRSSRKCKRARSLFGRSYRIQMLRSAR